MNNHGTVSRYVNKKFKCRCDRCKKAATEYQRARRASRPDVRERNLKQVVLANAKRQDYVNKLKDKPCEDCGESYPPFVMHFHHLDATIKERGISQFRSIRQIEQEVKKCVLLCANCHAIRTFSTLKA